MINLTDTPLTKYECRLVIYLGLAAMCTLNQAAAIWGLLPFTVGVFSWFLSDFNELIGSNYVNKRRNIV